MRGSMLAFALAMAAAPVPAEAEPVSGAVYDPEVPPPMPRYTGGEHWLTRPDAFAYGTRNPGWSAPKRRAAPEKKAARKRQQAARRANR